MLTFAAICPAAAVGSRVSVWAEGSYVHLEDKLVGPILAEGWVLLAICGAGIRAFAEERAAMFIGGRVIELETPCWPGKAQVEDAIVALGLAGDGLVAITDHARATRKRGDTYRNPFPDGSAESFAYTMGFDIAGYTTVARRHDGQEFGICDIGQGEYQSIVPCDLAADARGKCHTSLRDCLAYLRELMRGSSVTSAERGLACT